MGHKATRSALRLDRQLLSAAFPAAFELPRSGNPKRPLKIGIHNDIAERGGIPGVSGHPINQWRVSMVLSDYTSGRRYQEAIAAGGMRIDLDGKEVEPVTADQIEEAKRRLAAMPARKAAEPAAPDTPEPCTAEAQAQGCTCTMSHTHSASIDPPHEIVDPWCPIHGYRDADREYDEKRDREMEGRDYVYDGTEDF